MDPKQSPHATSQSRYLGLGTLARRRKEIVIISSLGAGLSNLGTWAWVARLLSTGASREAPVDNECFSRRYQEILTYRPLGAGPGKSRQV